MGASFWEKIYEEAAAEYGVTNIPVDTFNKVWVVPEEAMVYEYADTVYIGKSHLKVMLESDYVSWRNALGESPTVSSDDSSVSQYSELTTSVIREMILPAIEKEVNEGKNFSKLRQIFHSVILATWFKRNLQDSLLGNIFVDQKKITGVDVDDKEVKHKIFNQYVEAFKAGVYDYVKEEYDPVSQNIIPRKYFSGGVEWLDMDAALTVVQDRDRMAEAMQASPATLLATVDLVPHQVANSYIQENLPEGLFSEIYSQRRENIQAYTLIEANGVSARVVPIKGLLTNLGQLAHVGLGAIYGEPVVYIDDSYLGNEDIYKHELDEIRLWEGLRNDLGLDRSEMRTWIKNHFSEAARYAESIHNQSHSIDHIYREYQARNGALPSLQDIMTLYPQVDWQEQDVNIAAKFDKTKKLSDMSSFEIVQLLRSVEDAKSNHALADFIESQPALEVNKVWKIIDTLAKNKDYSIAIDFLPVLLKNMDPATLQGVKESLKDVVVKNELLKPVLSYEKNFREGYYSQNLFSILKELKASDMLEQIATDKNVTGEKRADAIKTLQDMYAFGRLERIATLYLKNLKLDQDAFDDPRKILQSLLSKTKWKLGIGVYHQASMIAAIGFLKQMRLSADNVSIFYAKELTRDWVSRELKELAKQGLPEYQISLGDEASDMENHIMLTFDSGQKIKEFRNTKNSLGVAAPLSRLKALPSQKMTASEIDNMKAGLKIEGRDVIVLGSPTMKEFKFFMKEYNSNYQEVPVSQRPVVIVGFRDIYRKVDLWLLKKRFLRNQEVVTRSGDSMEAWPSLKEKNFLILNTKGELWKLYNLKGMVVMGEDRNLIEPAMPGNSIYYFPGLWSNNHDSLSILSEYSAAEEFKKGINFVEIFKDRESLLLKGRLAQRAIAAFQESIVTESDNLALFISSLVILDKLQEDQKEKMVVDSVISEAEPSEVKHLGASNVSSARISIQTNTVFQEEMKMIMESVSSASRLTAHQLEQLGFNSNQEFFKWVTEITKTPLDEDMKTFKAQGKPKNGVQSLFFEDKDKEYGLKAPMSYNEDLMWETMNSYRLAQERLGGYVTPFRFSRFSPDKRRTHSGIAVLKIQPLTQDFIRDVFGGRIFVDKILNRFDAYVKERGVFDYDLLEVENQGVSADGSLWSLDFGFVKDAMNDDLYLPVRDLFEDDFNIMIDKMHDLRDILYSMSELDGKYFESKILEKFGIKLFLRGHWQKSMRGQEVVMSLSQLLRDYVKKNRPQKISNYYVYPLLGGKIDDLIFTEIEKRYEYQLSSRNAQISLGNGEDFAIATERKEAVGGIDLNMSILDVRTNGINLKFTDISAAQISDGMNIDGFSPIILELKPVANLPLTLGIAK